MIVSHFLTWGLSEEERRKAAAIDQSIYNVFDSNGGMERLTWRRVNVAGDRIIECSANERTLLSLLSREFLELPTVEIALRVRSAL